MDEVLEGIFSNVKDFLKFAESKSTMLVAANGVVLFGTLKLIDIASMQLMSKVIVFLILFLLVVSLLLSLSTFIPKLEMPWIVKRYGKSDGDNLIYFGDIQKYTPQAYLSALYKSRSQKEERTQYQIMISQQIIINSVITNYKFEVFGKSIRVFIFALLLLGIFLITEIWI